MKSRKPRVLQAVSWVGIATGIDMLLAAIYYLQDEPECTLNTLVGIYVAYLVVATVSHYLLAKYIVDQEKRDDTDS